MNDFFDIYTALGEGRDAQLAAPPAAVTTCWLQRQNLSRSAPVVAKLARLRARHADPERPPVPARTLVAAAAVVNCYTRLKMPATVRNCANWPRRIDVNTIRPGVGWCCGV